MDVLLRRHLFVFARRVVNGLCLMNDSPTKTNTFQKSCKYLFPSTEYHYHIFYIRSDSASEFRVAAIKTTFINNLSERQKEY